MPARTQRRMPKRGTTGSTTRGFTLSMRPASAFLARYGSEDDWSSILEDTQVCGAVTVRHGGCEHDSSGDASRLVTAVTPIGR